MLQQKYRKTMIGVVLSSCNAPALDGEKKQTEFIFLVTIPDPLDHICVNRLCVKSLTEDTNRLEVLSIKISESSAGSTSSQKSLGSPLDPDGQKHLNRPFSFLTSKHKIDFVF